MADAQKPVHLYANRGRREPQSLALLLTSLDRFCTEDLA